MHHEEGNRNPRLKISYASRPDAERETTKSGLLSDSLVGQRRSLHKRETRLRPQFIPIECRALSQPDIGPRPLAKRSHPRTLQTIHSQQPPPPQIPNPTPLPQLYSARLDIINPMPSRPSLPRQL